MEVTNEELVERYLAGDETAFQALTHRTLGPIYSFTLRLTGNEHDAQDITQETFIKAWKHLSSFKPQSSKFTTWLTHIARNTAIDYIRKKKHLPFSAFEQEGKNVLEETIPDATILAEEALIQTEDAHALQKVIDTLPLAQKEVLVLHYTNHLTFEEIGKLLNESLNTVKSRHYRALIALRKQFSQK